MRERVLREAESRKNDRLEEDRSHDQCNRGQHLDQHVKRWPRRVLEWITNTTKMQERCQVRLEKERNQVNHTSLSSMLAQYIMLHTNLERGFKRDSIKGISLPTLKIMNI